MALLLLLNTIISLPLPVAVTVAVVAGGNSKWLPVWVLMLTFFQIWEHSNLQKVIGIPEM